MSGAKTRFGFAGDGSEPPDSDRARGARTVIGRDIHLQPPAGFVPPKPPSASQPFPVASGVPGAAAGSPTPVVPSAMGRSSMADYLPDENTAELPSRRPQRRGRSRLARFLGRWTKSGRFVSEIRLSMRDDSLRIPRDPLGRNVLLVLLVAVLTFALTLLGRNLQRHFRAGAGRAAVVGSVAPAPAPQHVADPEARDRVQIGLPPTAR